MRPPDWFDSYTAAQWQTIGAIIARYRVDADYVTVGPSRRPLRDALEHLVAHHIARAQYALMLPTARRPSPVRTSVAAIEAVRQHVDAAALIVPQPARRAATALRDLDAALRAQLVEQLTAAGRPTNANKPVRTDYLIALTRIWDELTAGQPRLRKLKAEFLLACSQPTFGTNADVIKNFLDAQQLPLLSTRSCAPCCPWGDRLWGGEGLFHRNKLRLSPC